MWVIQGCVVRYGRSGSRVGEKRQNHKKYMTCKNDATIGELEAPLWGYYIINMGSFLDMEYE